MAFAVNYGDYRFARSIDLAAVAEALSEYGDVMAEGPSSVRFDPAIERWPATYFRSDGSIHVISNDLGLTAVHDYVDLLSRVVGARIVEDSQKH